jgi:hypothetical protein
MGNKDRWVDVGANVRGLSEERWKTYWSEMTAAEDMDFLKDPKSVLMGDGLIKNDYRVDVRIVNAEVPLTVAGPSCKVLLVFPDEKLALVTEYRHPR